MPINFGNLSVLVVEDTIPMRDLLIAVLGSFGVKKIVKASDGEQGFKLYRKESPDIVIADWFMEPMDGIEMTRRIRRSIPNKTVPVILITGHSSMARINEARDAGVTEFMVKPFSADDLAKRIAYTINHPRDFIDAEDYFGPDRRRRVVKDYKGPFRRENDK